MAHVLKTAIRPPLVKGLMDSLRAFKQVDVFTAVPYLGNPLAVVLDARGCSDHDMQRFARWTNLSETTFLLPPQDPAADYRVRIFTPAGELPFAGHPTLGSCHAWLEGGGTPKTPGTVVQECGVGLVELRRAQGRLAFVAPPLLKSGPLSPAELERTCRVLRVDAAEVVDAQWADNGPGWIAVRLASAEAVLALEPDFAAADVFDIGVVGPRKVGVVGQGSAQDSDVEVRAFFRSGGMAVEDPVTGSLNAAVAQWLLGDGTLSAPYVASQGTAIGRSGRVFVEQVGSKIWIGGDVVTCVDGTVNLVL